MKILKFKTNIDSEELVNSVAPYLDDENSISRWNIDTDDADHVLSVSGEHLEPGKVKEAVKKAGFEAEVIQVMGAGGGDI